MADYTQLSPALLNDALVEFCRMIDTAARLHREGAEPQHALSASGLWMSNLDVTVTPPTADTPTVDFEEALSLYRQACQDIGTIAAQRESIDVTLSETFNTMHDSAWQVVAHAAGVAEHIAVAADDFAQELISSSVEMYNLIEQADPELLARAHQLFTVNETSDVFDMIEKNADVNAAILAASANGLELDMIEILRILCDHAEIGMLDTTAD